VTAALECRELHAGYGSVAVVRDVSFRAERGSVLAVLGPNGAGKTSLMLALAGLLPRLEGQVHLDGELLPSGRAIRASRSGVVLVPDSRALFTNLTVAENIEAARKRGGTPAVEMLEVFPALEDRWKVSAGALSGGEQQMLALARAIVQRPRVLLIDEMSMGLAPIVVEKLLPVVRDIAEKTGAVVVLVEQHVALALEVADEALVLVHGEVGLRGPADVLAADADRLEDVYLGRT
jgi:branched-chain amino acid transport system ATP-binding protein